MPGQLLLCSTIECIDQGLVLVDSKGDGLLLHIHTDIVVAYYSKGDIIVHCSISEIQYPTT